jgi:glycosyltransferase involved in cell wall biosynthesis
VKVALMYPTYWPYVRRGVERYIHELAVYLVSQGHEVDVITSKPGAGYETNTEGFRVIYLPEIWHPVVAAHRPLLKFYTYGMTSLPVLLRGHYDVAHMWSYPYGPALWAAQRLQNMAYLYHSIVSPPHWPGAFDAWVYRKTFYGADRIAALTKQGVEESKRLFGVEPVVLPPPVDMNQFRPIATKDLDHPRILFTADMGDIRKGAILLLRSWPIVRRKYPEARLIFAGPFGLSGEIFTMDLLQFLPTLGLNEEDREHIEILGAGQLGSLPRLYSEAAVTVLPSIQEAFGMVLIESLACGTPVVASSFGGPAEIIDDPRIGLTVPLYSLNDIREPELAPVLAEALINAIELNHDPATPERCRERASVWSLDNVGRQVEQVYEEIVQARGRVVAPRHPVAARQPQGELAR